MKTCPLCRRTIIPRRPNAPMLRRLERIGHDDGYVEVATGASRYYAHKLGDRYPGWEFEGHFIGLFDGKPRYRIEARRK